MSTIALKRKYATSFDVTTDHGSWIKLSLIYLACWLVLDFDLATMPFHYLIVLLLVAIQFTSFYNATLIMLFAVFVPFAGSIMNGEISGLKLQRIILIPFLIQALNSETNRKLQFDQKGLMVIFISIVLLLTTDHIRHIVQTFPISEGMDEEFSTKNQIARYADNIVISFGFLYLIFRRLPLDRLKNLADIMILLMVLETITILYLVYQNPAMVIQSSNEFDKTYLWNNPYFGHKNNWGMLMVLFVFIILARMNTQKGKNRVFYITSLIIVVCGVGVSLSRQAYFTLFVGFLLVIIWQRDFKTLSYLILLIIALAIIQPSFVFDRMESMLAVRSAEEFQSLNTKVGDDAFRQIKENLSLIPMMFFKDWEYNWSEGFWNGMLLQLGILGLLYWIYMYSYLYSRFQSFYRLPMKKLKLYGMLCMLFIIIMTISNFNRRGVNFSHYNGNIEQIGFTVLFWMFYTEMLYHGLRQKVKGVLYL